MLHLGGWEPVYGRVGGEIQILLTQHDVAMMAGTPRPAVNRLLDELVGAGTVRLGRSRVHVLDPTALAVTKVDVLAGLAEVPLCVGYRVDGRETNEFPVDDLDRAEPVFLNMPGWDASVSEARSMEALPETVRRYLKEIEERTGVEVAIVSIGAERDATIVRREVLV